MRVDLLDLLHLLTTSRASHLRFFFSNVFSFFSGGFHPRRVLPCVLDIGTNNQKLIDDPRYLGSKHARLEGEEYYEFVDEFMVILISNLQKKNYKSEILLVKLIHLFAREVLLVKKVGN